MHWFCDENSLNWNAFWDLCVDIVTFFVDLRLSWPFDRLGNIPKTYLLVYECQDYGRWSVEFHLHPSLRGPSGTYTVQCFRHCAIQASKQLKWNWQKKVVLSWSIAKKSSKRTENSLRNRIAFQITFINIADKGVCFFVLFSHSCRMLAVSRNQWASVWT